MLRQGHLHQLCRAARRISPDLEGYIDLSDDPLPGRRLTLHPPPQSQLVFCSRRVPGSGGVCAGPGSEAPPPPTATWVTTCRGELAHLPQRLPGRCDAESHGSLWRELVEECYTVGGKLSLPPRAQRHPGPVLPRSLEVSYDQRLHLHLERLARGPVSTVRGIRVSTLHREYANGSLENIPAAVVRRRTGSIITRRLLWSGWMPPCGPVRFVGRQILWCLKCGHCHVDLQWKLDQFHPLYSWAVVQFNLHRHSRNKAHSQCGGDLTGPGGVILSPNWPECYGEGEDCSWRIHVGEDKRVLLDVQLLNISDNDMLTITDGDEVTTRILGRYVGGSSPFKLSSHHPRPDRHLPLRPGGARLRQGRGLHHQLHG
ncbi:seizure 6-like protein isoform X1 [Lates japonicus]|uniref:Seizure 6-like protein isoform X1 n=1 Tax=Lates japonicus TaxID=270547 RepID=A0AAD3MML5_LATJO|nr:seizure 6-like protein isoform X1 [Lates japonicus]